MTQRVQVLVDPLGANKRAAVAGPEQEKLDNARRNEQFHKQAALHARQDRRFATQENDSLRLQLAAVQQNFQASEDKHRRLHQLIDEGRRKMEEMHRDGANLQDLIVQDQDDLGKMAQQVAQARELQHERDAELAALCAQVQAQDDEVEHLRQRVRQSAAKKASSPIPKRRGRVSTELFNPGRPCLIELPLDPSPIPNRTHAEPSQPAMNPAITRFADALNMDPDVLSEFMAAMQLLNPENSRVTIGGGKRRGGEKHNNRKSEEKAAVAPNTAELVNKAHAMMRKTTYEMFGYEVATDFIFHVPATEEEVEAFAEDPSANITKWQFDFSEGYTGSAWNVAQMERLVAEAEKNDNRDQRYLQKGLIKREFLEYVVAEQLTRYRAEWNQLQPKWDVEKDRMETTAEAMARGQAILRYRRLSSKTINAQHDKYNHRLSTIKATIALKEEDDANNLPTWERMLELLKLLGPSGMSEEEEAAATHKGGAKMRAYKIKLCVWRVPVIVDYMRMVDAQTGHFQTLQTGTKPAPRIRSQDHGSRSIPKGLPEALYNKSWLKSLSTKELKEVKVSKQAFALFVAATERMRL
ncbi:unnamed protein product [Mycena citricolor]|uniref:Uncharacterized protein n=1 Tax=Mycena citricolor TaxID=2018698 RepID=A0AAD2Q2K3_9AGAR|nr:unnamed protein product [Mycena citricolor]